MSFKVRELMIDVLPATRLFSPAVAGLALCGEATRTSEEDEDDVECGEATRVPGGGTPPPANRPEADLAMLRQQLRQALSAAP
ncbi:MAG TPA: hypothetical protein VF173_29570 [Thermoanaerobaculia bacterium]|nr:hypothetical protein [Thermoanaerobaculia bacterium]